MSRKTRKLIWSAPLVAVLAVAGALAMFAALGARGGAGGPRSPLPGVRRHEPDGWKPPRDIGRSTWCWSAPSDGRRGGELPH